MFYFKKCFDSLVATQIGQRVIEVYMCPNYVSSLRLLMPNTYNIYLHDINIHPSFHSFLCITPITAIRDKMHAVISMFPLQRPFLRLPTLDRSLAGNLVLFLSIIKIDQFMIKVIILTRSLHLFF